MLEIINILKIIRNKIQIDTDIVWTKYESIEILQTEIDKFILQLEKGDLKLLLELNSMFGPTSTFQEISISNGWEEEFLKLADLFDQEYEKLIKNVN